MWRLIIPYLIISAINVTLSYDQSREWLEDQFYAIAESRHKNRSTRDTPPLRSLHLLRVPKAGSTSMSVLARRLAGCNPPGPCCEYPGTPPGSCPSKDLFKCDPKMGGPVIGCTHHRSNYNALLNFSIPSISMMREPISRSLSALFYPGIHHNSKCSGSQTACFLAYVKDNRFKNVAVKMFSGCYAYASEMTCEKKSQCKCSLERALEHLEEPSRLVFVGVAELWETSLLLFYDRFPSLMPKREEFGLQSSSNHTRSRQHGAGGVKEKKLRLRGRLNYADFKLMVVSEPTLQNALATQNALDSILYERVWQRLKRELHQSGLAQLDLVKRQLQEFSQKKYHK